MREIADILERAADLIEPEGAWHQGSCAALANGLPVDWSEKEATSFCAIAAVWKIAGHQNSDAEKFFRHVLGQPPGLWNDVRERTQVEVVAKLREAAAKSRGEP